MATASVHVTKLTAAKRQLQAAIRMYFQPEDGLAVHTVAAAVYGLLKGIKNSRGMNEAADAHLVSIFYAVRDYRRGTLPPHLSSDAEFMLEISQLAEELTPITADSKIEDVRVSLGGEVERQYWNETNKAANFLKHADRLNEPPLDIDIIDNRLLLLKCLSAYQDLTPDDVGNEGMVFAAYVSAENDSYQGLGENSFFALVDSMRRVPVEYRSQMCYKIIHDMNASE
jgi:hypothetical protein